MSYLLFVRKKPANKLIYLTRIGASVVILMIIILYTNNKIGTDENNIIIL